MEQEAESNECNFLKIIGRLQILNYTILKILLG